MNRGKQFLSITLILRDDSQHMLAQALPFFRLVILMKMILIRKRCRLFSKINKLEE